MRKFKMAALLIITIILLFTGCPTGMDGVSTPSGEDLIVYVDANYTGANSDGSSNKPLTSISYGLVQASILGYSSVYVAIGDYNVTYPIDMIEGISLYGGYNSLDWSRSEYETKTAREVNSTTITYTGRDDGSLESPNSVVYAGSGVTVNTIIEGFTLEGKANGDYSSAILTRGGSPAIRYNTIIGGSGGGTKFGIYNYSSSPSISHNAIDGGSGGGSTGGISNDSSSPSINNNTIDGGSGGGGTYGIDNDSSSPSIRNNTITGGSGGGNRLGIWNTSSSSPTIINNIIVIVASVNSKYGILNLSSSSPTVQNNCIYVNGTDSGHSYAGPVGNIATNPGINFSTDAWHDGYVIGDLAITSGGMDLSGDFTTDKDGNTRTVPWSIGAFEFD